jgi:hemoglobin-like flavoprotein
VGDGKMNDAGDHDARATLRKYVLRVNREEARAIVTTFYAELFYRFPDLRRYFVGLDLEQQADKVWSVLRLAVARELNAAQVADSAARVGRVHASRGVGAPQYAAFISTLADVLAVTQRHLPADEARRLWMDELRALSALMGGTAASGTRNPANGRQ